MDEMKSVADIAKPNEILLLDLWGKLPTPGAVYADITWVGFTGDVVPEPFATCGMARITASGS